MFSFVEERKRRRREETETLQLPHPQARAVLKTMNGFFLPTAALAAPRLCELLLSVSASQDEEGLLMTPIDNKQSAQRSAAERETRRENIYCRSAACVVTYCNKKLRRNSPIPLVYSFRW